MRESTDTIRIHAAWVMTQKCVKEALAYDVRIIPADLLEEHMKRIEKAVRG